MEKFTCKNLVLILGMHRSGTSAVSGILSSAGFFAGNTEDLIEGNIWNRDGYFERRDICRLNDKILTECGGTWDVPPEENSIISGNHDEHILSIKQILLSFKNKSFYFIKDPRLCLTIPVWKSALGNNIKILFVSRKIEAVCDSLYKREGFPKEKSAKLYNIYLERASKYVADFPHFNISYEDLFSSNRPDILIKLADFLEIDNDLEKIAKEIIDPYQRHDTEAVSLPVHDLQLSYNMITELIKKGSFNEALNGLYALIEIHSDRDVLYKDIGVLLHKIGETQKAMQFLEKAVSLPVHDLQLSYNMITELVKKGSLNEALNGLYALVEIHSERAVLYNDIGVLLHKQGETQKAIQFLEKAVTIEPDNKHFLQNLSSINKISKKSNSSASIQTNTSNDSLKILIVYAGHLLIPEIWNGLLSLGHEPRMLELKKGEMLLSEVEPLFKDTIEQFRPDFILTINHLGFDMEGHMTGTLERYKIPFASWFVDSPILIINHYHNNRSPLLALFMWDEDYVEPVKNLGFNFVEYLPLGTDPSIFHPIKDHDKGPSGLVGFVGNSMRLKTASALKRNGIPAELLKKCGEIAENFLYASHLFAHDFIADKFPDIDIILKSLPERASSSYLAAIIWEATGRYRKNIISKIGRFNPTIAGDPGWKDILDNNFNIISELNYYKDLPLFYNNMSVNIDITSRQMKQSANQRVFDVSACCGLLLTDFTKQKVNLFEPDNEIILYECPDAVPDLIDKALKDKIFSDKIKKNAYKRVLSQHTYRHRLENLIAHMRKYFGI